MRARIFYSRKSKGMMAIIATLSLLALALPCNCMAIENPEPVKNEHPCHSSSDSPSNDTQEHDNCCCDGDDCSLLSEVGVVGLIAHSAESENKSFDISYGAAAFSGQRLVKAGAIRGSPPTDDVFTIHSKTFLALLQRWLI